MKDTIPYLVWYRARTRPIIYRYDENVRIKWAFVDRFSRNLPPREMQKVLRNKCSLLYSDWINRKIEW